MQVNSVSDLSFGRVEFDALSTLCNKVPNKSLNTIRKASLALKNSNHRMYFQTCEGDKLMITVEHSTKDPQLTRTFKEGRFTSPNSIIQRAWEYINCFPKVEELHLQEFKPSMRMNSTFV